MVGAGGKIKDDSASHDSPIPARALASAAFAPARLPKRPANSGRRVASRDVDSASGGVGRRGGATFFDDPDFGLLASFQGAPGGIGPFRIVTETDDVVGDVSAGVDVIATNGSSFSVYYDGRFGDTVEAHEGGVKGTLAF